MPARERLPEEDADRPDVCGRARLLAAEPFGRDVGERPGHVAGRGQRLLAVHSGEPEVEQANRDLVALGKQHVGGLHVAVDDPV